MLFLMEYQERLSSCYSRGVLDSHVIPLEDQEGSIQHRKKGNTASMGINAGSHTGKRIPVIGRTKEKTDETKGKHGDRDQGASEVGHGPRKTAREQSLVWTVKGEEKESRLWTERALENLSKP